MIRQPLLEAGDAAPQAGLVSVDAFGAQAAADMQDVQAPETYIGYKRAENLARDLHLVLDPAASGDHGRFRVTIDGDAPAASHGAGVDADGNGVVDTQRLYQLVRQAGPVADHEFEIQFLDPGVQAYAFTFG